ncbi:ribonucleotide reductase N-terminal alpha domain-containing protein [Sphaerotilus sp.]|uniref:ribonucleotide reductase N-terminal alpha domain-containing protein n=1 Tax=Sphaerotilus sp. TaxID=2093942 RepID=UPI0025D801B3|nr:ribonucleotide reductase N-terminal alpha domain-containing protein [Sphaerotilus sp.]
MSRLVASLPAQPISREVLQEKYAKGTETTADEVRLRVARALAAVEPEVRRAHWTERFAWAQAQGFVPAGRIASAAGTALGATLINCFVQPVGDSIAEPENGFPGIYTALTEAAETMRRGGGVGYDFSRIRPQGAWVGSTDSHASGPVSYMRVFDRSCETVESAGSRRGAQMGVLRCDHPDIEAFIHAKDSGDLRNFNVSVGVTNAFMRAVESDGEIDLTHRAEPGRKLKTAGAFERADGLWVYRRVRARDLWDQIMRATYDHAEPGILFIDRINEDNNLGYCEAITATNPCVTGDTRLATQFGLIPIRQLHASGLPLEVTVDNRALGDPARGTQVRSAVPAFLTAGQAEVFRVVTQDGYEIKATAWHDFYTARGKLKLSELVPGDELLVQSGKGQFGFEGGAELGARMLAVTREALAVGQADIRIPDAVWWGSEACVRTYLDGLHAALRTRHSRESGDAEVGRNDETGWRDTACVSAHPGLLRDVQMLLANWGLVSTLLPLGDADQPDLHALAIVDRPGFTTRITEILPAGIEPVYDTTQADQNSVIFNGLVTGQCGEQPLPSYGCCCLGSVDLTRFVHRPFEPDAAFDEAGFAEVCAVATRMLDNVLDATVWPLPAQQREAMHKRRIGLGFTGLGDALIMLGCRYDTEPARDMARRISAVMRDAAYGASVELAKERGAFPLFDADQYLGGESFASRLPDELKDRIYAYGLRNSHLLSIAPTGTISLAFADNASNGIEPPFSWTYTRRKREADGSFKEYAVEDHAWRLYRHLKGADAPLTDAFVTALDMSAEAHEAMVAAVAPYIDTSISKTVNVPADYPYAEFQGLYFTAWKSGLKGLATYRPNSVLGAVLSVEPAAAPALQPQPLTVAQPAMAIDPDGANRRLRVERLPQPVLASLRWPGRPELPSGNPAWSYMVQHPHGSFSLFVGELPAEAGPDAGLFGQTLPFEVWVNGAEQPRGLGALAKTLSMDMRANDPSWLRLKLDALATVAEERAFDMPFPPSGEKRLFPGVVAATAAVIRWRCEQLGALQEGGATPVLDAMFSRHEPRTGVDGTLAWAVDLENPGTGEQFTLTLKEVTLPTPEGGYVTRPCAIGFAGNYPRALDGLARLLSLDMRVIDPAWIGMKLRKLLNVGEPLGHFMAPVPGLPAGQRRQQVWPSTVAYVARLVIHRYAMLGVLDEAGVPVNAMGVLATPAAAASAVAASIARATVPGKPCPECGNATVIHKDGCEFCTACGYVGACG